MTLFGRIVRCIRINARRQILPKSKENPLPVATHIVQKAWGDLLILSSEKKITKLNPLEIMPSFLLKAAVEIFTNQIMYQTKKS